MGDRSQPVSLAKLNLLASIEICPHAPFKLLDLPSELRRQIYSYCIPRRRLVNVDPPTRFTIACHWDSSIEDPTLRFTLEYWGSSRNWISLLTVCKQVSNESLDILYGENAFRVYLYDDGEICLRRDFSAANRQRIRYLLVITDVRCFMLQPESLPDALLWSSILPNLTALRIIAEKPIEDENYDNISTYFWLKMLKPYLECFSRHLQIATVVEVDDDEADELIKNYLPNGYRQVRCRIAGDYIFRRGKYFSERYQ